MGIAQYVDIQLGDITFSNHKPFVLIGGLNVLESETLAFDVCEHFVRITKQLGLAFVFKASFDKANRSSVHSFRGQTLEEGLRIFAGLKKEFGVFTVTDVHESWQVPKVARVCDIIQIPAFLARQTDLLKASAEQNCILHIKKPQFMSPTQMRNVVEKVHYFGQQKILLCERGSCFGYDNLVVDMLGIAQMKRTCANLPITFDVTHALQCRNPLGVASDGRRSDIYSLAKAGVATGLAGLFLEAHPDPERALCDGPCALPLQQLEPFLSQMQQLDALVKDFPLIEVD